MTTVSNPDKVLFPAEGFTKADLVGYYEAAADAMSPHIAGRPLTLHRFPNGIGQKGFMQKNASDFFPDDIQRLEVPKQGGTTNYAVLEDGARLPYLANLGTITFHVWTSAQPHVDHPDRLIFDLDPPADSAGAAADAARLVRDFLADLGLDTAVMTTGSKGYHVVAVIEPEHDFETMSPFAQTAAALMAHSEPGVLTDEFRIAKREGRVFVDWLRNRKGQTGVAAWSVRAREGAPVATPIEWDELDVTPPDAFTIETAVDRFSNDSIGRAVEVRQSLTTAIERVRALADDAGIEPAEFDRFRS